MVAADAKEMLAGEIRSDDTAYAVRTTQQMLVELAGWYVRNSVALATLVTDLGDRMPGSSARRLRRCFPRCGTAGSAAVGLSRFARYSIIRT